ncbi:CaiB/BaiF CoA transferase family protein [Nocardia flavorosea]|uniref:CoA transferase n=1 Tax=Nocardia flavorosea TaxID=53429 RepID=A0A846YST4_9NOCA|nr:CaiB/BaiF CoA-transferase family protein [Nocardia flavorosea]NKY60518.1 CoA transferase [Nocardia flavorosea]
MTAADRSGSPAPRGPLQGVKVIEIAGLGPGPYAAMLLADMGADVVRVDRPGPVSGQPELYALARGRRSLAVDMKKAEGLATLLDLVDTADILIEGFRPGVAERLGFGPDVCHSRNARLVYARMTGWGQDGPFSRMAGHDLNYLGLTGALTLLQSSADSPPPSPPGFIADFGGGGLMMAFGIVSALHEAQRSGSGQVVDAAMVDGVASLTTLIYSMTAQGRWNMDRPGTNFCDGAAPYYAVYETADGKYLAVAPIEPQFYATMIELLGLTLDELPDREDPANWAELKELLAGIFRTKPREHWTGLFDGTDACVTPVLNFAEARQHPHNAARGTFVEEFGVVQPAPAPRLGGTPAAITRPPAVPGAHSREVLLDWGLSAERVGTLIDSGVVTERPA